MEGNNTHIINPMSASAADATIVFFYDRTVLDTKAESIIEQ